MHDVTVSLSDFGMSALAGEAERQGISSENLAAHAVMYYLADLDSGRLAAKVPDALRVAVDLRPAAHL